MASRGQRYKPRRRRTKCKTQKRCSTNWRVTSPQLRPFLTNSLWFTYMEAPGVLQWGQRSEVTAAEVMYRQQFPVVRQKVGRLTEGQQCHVFRLYRAPGVCVCVCTCLWTSFAVPNKAGRLTDHIIKRVTEKVTERERVKGGRIWL